MPQRRKDYPENRKLRESWKDGLALTIVTILVAFVLLPAGVTTVAPVSTIRLHREGEAVRATVRQHVFLFLPWRSRTLEPVTKVSHDFTAGSLPSTGTPSPSDVRSEDSATLVLTGPTGAIVVPVSPANIEAVERQARGFVEEPGPADLNLWVVANWKVGVLAGGFLTLLSLLFVLAVADNLVRKAIRRVRHGGPKHA